MSRKCPCCNTPVYLDDDLNSYVVCTNYTCKMVYIPKIKLIRDEVTEHFFTQETFCINCRKEVYPFCMSHNNQYWICHHCDCANPHDLDTRKEMYKCYHGTAKCSICKYFYDETHYSYRDMRVSICGVCYFAMPYAYRPSSLADDDWSYSDIHGSEYSGDGRRYVPMDPDDFPEIVLPHVISKPYLPPL